MTNRTTQGRTRKHEYLFNCIFKHLYIHIHVYFAAFFSCPEEETAIWRKAFAIFAFSYSSFCCSNYNLCDMNLRHVISFLTCCHARMLIFLRTWKAKKILQVPYGPPPLPSVGKICKVYNKQIDTCFMDFHTKF